MTMKEPNKIVSPTETVTEPLKLMLLKQYKTKNLQTIKYPKFIH